ncbi:aminotransferase class V-fold PLP-dependent enzyme [Pseudonocardia saturnea]
MSHLWPSVAHAAELDARDPLAFARQRFVLPQDAVYGLSTCLGPLSGAVPDAVARAVSADWGRDLLSAWFDAGWWDAPARVGDKIGRLLGAAPGQVVVGDSTTVHLFNVLVAAARSRPERRVLLTTAAQFSTVRYITDSVAELLNLQVRRVPAADLRTAVGSDVAVVVDEPVDFRTSEAHSLAGVARAAHEAGAVVVADLSHAAGVLPVDLDAHGVDFAVGCTYKYLCGGPGSPAFVYINARHHTDGLRLALPGWIGHAEPFEMREVYRPAGNADRARIGTPPILSMVALESALGSFDGITIEQIRRRGLSLSDHFFRCVDELLPADVEIATPRDPERRGGHVAVRHPRAAELVARLAERGVLGDRRPPDLVRVGLHPLTVTHREVLRVVTELAHVLSDLGPVSG